VVLLLAISSSSLASVLTYLAPTAQHARVGVAEHVELELGAAAPA